MGALGRRRATPWCTATVGPVELRQQWKHWGCRSAGGGREHPALHQVLCSGEVGGVAGAEAAVGKQQVGSRIFAPSGVAEIAVGAVGQWSNKSSRVSKLTGKPLLAYLMQRSIACPLAFP